VDYGEPISYLVLEKGVDVISSDGDRIGTVEHVIADEADDIFEGIVVDTRPGPGGKVFVDASQIDEIREQAVELKIGAAEAKSLPKPSANPGAIELHGVDDIEGKLRRAWEKMTGR
jgi:sporulation protein YlmC with PRC-barrel domain